MAELKFEVSVDYLPGFRADAVRGNSVFEVILEPREMRHMRSSLVEMARIAGHGQQAILVLDEPSISNNRLFEEWQGIQTLLKPHVLENLSLYIRREEDLNETLGRELSDQELDDIDLVAEYARSKRPRASRRPSEASFDVLRVVLIHWIRKSGPLTSKEIAEETGFSYPTIARSLDQLEPHLKRHSDRRVELQSFPKDAWQKLVAQVGKVRCSRGYTDRSGRPRQLESLMGRLQEPSLRNLCHNSVAVGGTYGARHYLPSIDLFGNPRLDLIVNAQSGRGHRPVSIDTLIRKLDPALKPAERGEPSQVVVHSLYRPESFFSETKDGTLYADEVECLLDLHEARLEQQALEFLDKLSPRKNA